MTAALLPPLPTHPASASVRPTIGFWLALIALVAMALGAIPLVLKSRLQPGPDRHAVNTGSLATTEMEQAAIRASICSSSNAPSTGLRGQYFANQQMRGAPLFVRTDQVIELDGTEEWLKPASGQSPSAARWTGWVKAPITGSYQFHAAAQFARLTVANTVFVDSNAQPTNATIELAAGRFYPIALEVKAPDGKQMAIRLEWTAPHGQRYVIPKALLFLPTQTNADLAS